MPHDGAPEDLRQVVRRRQVTVRRCRTTIGRFFRPPKNLSISGGFRLILMTPSAFGFRLNPCQPEVYKVFKAGLRYLRSLGAVRTKAPEVSISGISTRSTTKGRPWRGTHGGDGKLKRSQMQVEPPIKARRADPEAGSGGWKR